MSSPGVVSSCAVCASLVGPERREPIFEDELWHVRHIDPPYAVPGWMMFISRRHVGGPAHFSDREAASFGPALRHFERLLEEVTGALRVYTAALGESSPHFHAHMVPRYAVMPKEARAWAVFDLERAARAGEIAADPAEVSRVIDAYRAALVKIRRPRCKADTESLCDWQNNRGRLVTPAAAISKDHHTRRLGFLLGRNNHDDQFHVD